MASSAGRAAKNRLFAGLARPSVLSSLCGFPESTGRTDALFNVVGFLPTATTFHMRCRVLLSLGGRAITHTCLKGNDGSG